MLFIVHGKVLTVGSLLVSQRNIHSETSFKALRGITVDDIVICGEFEAHDIHWHSTRPRERGRELLAMAGAVGLIVANEGSPTFLRG